MKLNLTVVQIVFQVKGLQPREVGECAEKTL
jgi:hypothetical protein